MILGRKKTLLRFRALFIACFLMVIAYPVFAGDEKDPNPFNLPDRVMALPPEMRAGQIFQGFPSLRPQVNWYPIAPGLVGNWRSSSMRVLRQDDFETGAYYTLESVEEDVLEVHLGDLLDSASSVWHALISPEIHDYQKGDLVDSRDTISIKMLGQSPNHLMVQSRVFHVIYNPQNNQIVTSYTEESVRQYDVGSNSRMIGHEYVRLYDPDGFVKMSAQTMRVFSPVGKFTQVNERAGLHLPSSLASHLQSIGRHDLINW